jgi:hypothetical protein
MIPFSGLEEYHGTEYRGYGVLLKVGGFGFNSRLGMMTVTAEVGRLGVLPRFAGGVQKLEESL